MAKVKKKPRLSWGTRLSKRGTHAHPARGDRTECTHQQPYNKWTNGQRTLVWGLCADVPAIVGGKLTSFADSLRHAAASRRRPVDS
jgi:hypothetical protein